MKPSLIAIEAAPNARPEYAWLALNLILTPWKWRQNDSLQKLKHFFLERFQSKSALPLASGRLALQLLLSLVIKPDDEVLIQAFTCLVVPNAVAWAGGKPVFVDIDPKTYNLDPNDVRKKITPRTRVLIVQHTFGIPAPLDQIKTICDKYKIVLIEDCAHALGAKYRQKLLGTYGAGAIFSFNQDKVISGVRGGLMTINHANIDRRMKLKKLTLSLPSKRSIFKRLLHPLLWSIAIPLYDTLLIGKGLVFIAWRLGVLDHAVACEEQEGKEPINSPVFFSNPQAKLVLAALARLEQDNARRQFISARYQKELSDLPITHPLPPVGSQPIYMRYPVQVDQPEKIIRLARKKNILLGKWYFTPIMPWSAAARKYYRLGSCPTAEDVGKKVVNLPTYPRMTDEQINRVIKVMHQAYGHR